MADKQLFGCTTTLTNNNQIVLPKNIREEYNVLPGSKIVWLSFEEVNNGEEELELALTIKIIKNKG